MSEVDIPDDVFGSIKIPEDEKKDELKLELAISLYDRGALSFGKARELAEVSKAEFHKILGERKIERNYQESDLKDDLKYAESK